jgi:thiol-disulfide isomerase/thioredoxin
MLPLQHPLPQFSLPLVSGHAPWSSLNELVKSDDLPERPLLVMLMCAHCPFVKHVEPEITRLEADFGDQITLLAISSNSLSTHPQDGREGLRHQADRHGWRFPYLLDEQQKLAKNLRGACTPEFYAFAPDANGTQTLRYRGQLDASRPGNDQPLDGADLRAALRNIQAGTPVSEMQLPSVGCNIKWNPGHEPPWFGQST